MSTLNIYCLAGMRIACGIDAPHKGKCTETGGTEIKLKDIINIVNFSVRRFAELFSFHAMPPSYGKVPSVV